MMGWQINSVLVLRSERSERLEGRSPLMLRDASHLRCDAPQHEEEIGASVV
jgi:hypothetical protein